MGFLNFFFSWSRPIDPLPRQEIRRVIDDHERKLAELQEAVEALRGEDDDEDDARAR